MNVATYLKFDGISNVLVDVRPSRLPANEAPARPLGAASSPAGLSAKSQLDTSFNVHMTLGNALEQLSSQQDMAFGSQQTPALGKCPRDFRAFQFQIIKFFRVPPPKKTFFSYSLSLSFPICTSSNFSALGGPEESVCLFAC